MDNRIDASRMPQRPTTGPDWGFTGVVVAGAVAVTLLVLGTAIGIAAGWATFGLWIAGFVPIGYGVTQLFARRRRRSMITIGAGLLTGIVALSAIPAGSGTIAEPAAVTTGSGQSTSTSAPSEPEPSTPSPSASESSSHTSTSPSSTAPASTPPPASSRPPQPTPTTTPTKAPAKLTSAQQTVAALTVKGRGPQTGYDRGLFHWNGFDFDRNGCDQRNDVLKRDMDKPVIKPGSNGCRVEAGWLQDRYSGTAIYLPREKIDIDHVVALSNAWQMGAAQWSDTTRRQFANDPLNLVATTQHLNRQKGDSNAASWLPPKNRCSYIARQAAVKHKYGLAITDSERDAMNRILQACPNQALPTGNEAAPRQQSSTSPAPPKPSKAKPKPSKPKPAKPATSVVPPKKAQPPAPQTDRRFGTCKEAKRNGYGPYVRGKDPEYGWYRDSDKDGVVCE